MYIMGFMRKTPPPKLAQIKVKYAVDNGVLEKPCCCEQCGNINQNLHGHHEDYSKPLKVKWLCPKCHKRQHPRPIVLKFPLNIAAEVGVTPDFISKLNKKTRQPTPETALKIVRAMKKRGVSLYPKDLFFPETLRVFKELFEEFADPHMSPAIARSIGSDKGGMSP
jgi:hypothetical protein